MSENIVIAADRPLADTGWRTLTVRLIAVAVAAGLGRWLAGGTFGYVLFAAVWGPVAAAHVTRSSRGQALMAAASVSAILALPMVKAWPLSVILKLSGIFLLMNSVTAIWSAVGMSRIGRPLASAWVSLAWLTWVIWPATGGSALADGRLRELNTKLLAVHPLPALNRLDTTAADWTHQAVAYQWLTGLGQSEPFEWPASTWPFFGLHASLIATGLVMGRVPRGTTPRRNLSA